MKRRELQRVKEWERQREKEGKEIQQRIWQKQVNEEQMELQKKKEKRVEEKSLLRYRSIAARTKFSAMQCVES